MRLIDAEPIIKNLSAMKTQIGYDAISIDGMIKALGEAEEVTDDQTPNPPLTLEELREMDGEPVFIVSKRYRNGWCIVQWRGVSQSWMYFSRTGTAEGMTATPITAREYGDDWLAYRRKPEESET